MSNKYRKIHRLADRNGISLAVWGHPMYTDKFCNFVLLFLGSYEVYYCKMVPKTVEPSTNATLVT